VGGRTGSQSGASLAIRGAASRCSISSSPPMWGGGSRPRLRSGGKRKRRGSRKLMYDRGTAALPPHAPLHSLGGVLLLGKW